MRELTEILTELGLRPAEAKHLAKRLPPPPGARSYLVSLIQELDKPPVLVLGRDQAQRVLDLLADLLSLKAEKVPEELNSVSLERLQDLIMAMLKRSAGYFRPTNREALHRAVAEEAKMAVADAALLHPLSFRNQDVARCAVESAGQALVDRVLQEKVAFPDFFKFVEALRQYLRALAEHTVALLSREERMRRLWAVLRSEVEAMVAQALELLRTRLLSDHLDLAWPEPLVEDLLERLEDLAFERAQAALDLVKSPLQVLELVRRELEGLLALELGRMEEEARAAKVQAPLSLSTWVAERERLLQVIESEVGALLSSLAQAMGKDRARLLDSLLARVLEAGLSRLGEGEPTLDELRALVRKTFARHWPELAHVP